MTDHVFTETTKVIDLTIEEEEKEEPKKEEEPLPPNAIPMSPSQMANCLSEQCGKPCVLHEEGTSVIVCPYCGDPHDHPNSNGHYVAGCADTNEGTSIVMGNRSFIPRHRYTIFEYKETCDGGNVHYEIRHPE